MGSAFLPQNIECSFTKGLIWIEILSQPARSLGRRYSATTKHKSFGTGEPLGPFPNMDWLEGLNYPNGPAIASMKEKNLWWTACREVEKSAHD